MANMEYLFVYDELRTTQGHPMHNYLRALCDYLGEASVGGTLVDVEGRPGLLPSGNPEERVSGELYRIHDGASDELFGVLDHFEGCGEDEQDSPGFFRHRLFALLHSEQQLFDAWVYVYAG